MAATLSPDRIKEAEFVRTVFAVAVPAGTTLAEMASPAYWTHVAARLQNGSRLEVTPEDGAWYAELYVVACAKTWAKTVLLRQVALESSEPLPDETHGFTIAWGGNLKKFRVVRDSDKAELKAEFPTKREAGAWLDNYLLALTA